jgi:hypothetical protein
MEAPTPLQPQLTYLSKALLLMHQPGKHSSWKSGGWPIWPRVSDPRP